MVRNGSPVTETVRFIDPEVAAKSDKTQIVAKLGLNGLPMIHMIKSTQKCTKKGLTGLK